MLRKLLSLFALTLVGLGISYSSTAQITGCTNPIACNYIVSATVDNGFCQIPVYYVDTQSTLNCDCDFTEYVTPLDQACALSVINADPFCANNMWDTACEDAYNDCCPSGGSWYIPNTLLNSVDYTPMVFACEAPENYTTLQPEYALAFAVLYSNCFYSNWYIGCADLYNEAVFGCANPGYWIPITTDGNSTVTQGCVHLGGAYTLADVDCINEVIANDPFCLDNVWDQYSQDALVDCVNGCTYPFACNYSPNEVKEDQTCEFPGCTDSTALNYLAYAGCDDGSCVFSEVPTCMGDLNDDGAVNVVDLTQFLAVFGAVCAN